MFAHISIDLIQRKSLYNVHYRCNKEDSSIFGAASCDMMFFEAWNLTPLSFSCGFCQNVSSPLIWASASLWFSVAALSRSTPPNPRWYWTTTGPSWASNEPMEMTHKKKCSYASCDGPVHCLLCFISLISLFNSYLDNNVWKCSFGLIKKLVSNMWVEYFWWYLIYLSLF